MLDRDIFRRKQESVDFDLTSLEASGAYINVSDIDKSKHSKERSQTTVVNFMNITSQVYQSGINNEEVKQLIDQHARGRSAGVTSLQDQEMNNLYAERLTQQVSVLGSSTAHNQSNFSKDEGNITFNQRDFSSQVNELKNDAQIRTNVSFGNIPIVHRNNQCVM